MAQSASLRVKTFPNTEWPGITTREAIRPPHLGEWKLKTTSTSCASPTFPSGRRNAAWPPSFIRRAKVSGSSRTE